MLRRMKFLAKGDGAKGTREGAWVLVAVLAAACISMAAVSLEQAHTIKVQRQLIHELFQDSLHLNAARMQHLAPRHSH
jgi:hypothetical protein